MRRGKRFAKRRERYETAEAALGPETPGAKAFAVSGDRVHAFIAPTLFWSSVNIFACLLRGELGVKPVRRMEQELFVTDPEHPGRKDQQRESHVLLNGKRVMLPAGTGNLSSF